MKPVYIPHCAFQLIWKHVIVRPQIWYELLQNNIPLLRVQSKHSGELNFLFKMHSILVDPLINSFWNDFLRLLATEQSYLEHICIKIEPK